MNQKLAIINVRNATVDFSYSFSNQVSRPQKVFQAMQAIRHENTLDKMTICQNAHGQFSDAHYPTYHYPTLSNSDYHAILVAYLMQHTFYVDI